ncbi:hypothetical protein Fmac_013972 [Flemingia macrophylla]|uniref:Uncharacterized protein n=1 Tax=Flemingia macrophylla TaxID=520843 RepID=A0ABD1MAG9_9FABA
MSAEALTMAGADFMECTMNIGALEESFDLQLQPSAKKSQCRRLDNNGMAMEWMKMKMREWAKAVASNNQIKVDLRVSEIILIMHNHLI